MNHMIHITTLSAALIAGAANAESYQAGLAEIAISDQQTDRPLTGIVWYPTDANVQTQRVHSNPVWQGVDAVMNAQKVDGQFPLVVMSHGMYGNMMNQNWLASELARDGFIVMAVNHPGTSTWLRDPKDARQLWERPRDISRTITFALKQSELSDKIDASRIYMAGHSLGGWTAMALAGAEFDPEAFDAFCAGGTDPLVCGIMDRWQVGKTPEDRAALAQSYADDRIAAFAVFDLGGTQSFSAESLGQVSGDFLIMGAPQEGSGINLDVESRDLVAKLTTADVKYIEPETLGHFDFLGICTPMGQAILKEEEPEDAFICEGGRDERAQKHKMITASVKAQFSE